LGAGGLSFAGLALGFGESSWYNNRFGSCTDDLLLDVLCAFSRGAESYFDLVGGG